MNARPILFSAPMVRAILDGRKTVTRRIVTVPWKGSTRALPYEPYYVDSDGRLLMACEMFDDATCDGPYCEYTEHVATFGEPGDRLWVRETFAPRYFDDGRPGYRADWTSRVADVCPEPKWKPAIFMRPSESRITLGVVSIRVERLHAIDEEDARREGVNASDASIVFRNDAAGRPKVVDEMANTHRGAFAILWDEINGKRAPWESNPWVWRVEFRRVTGEEVET